jgi:hypothetical protein
MPRLPSRAAASAAVFVLACLGLAACGGSSSGGKSTNASTTSTTAGPAFPVAGGRSLTQVLAGIKQGPMLAPAVGVLEPGLNRFAFVLFDASRKQLVPPEVAVYVADGNGRSVRGPFPVTNESLAVAPPYQSQTVQADANAAKQVYVTHIPLTKAKSQGIIVVARMNGQLVAANPTLVDGPQPPTPGQKAISVHTPTSPPQPIASIDTRTPHDPQLHAVDLANVLGRKPVLLVFATPQLCQSRTCGPVVDQAAQLQATYGSRMAFIHMEVYNGNDPTKGQRPQLRAWRLPSEPWVFAIDRHGRVVDRLEGASSIAEMRVAIEKALNS